MKRSDEYYVTQLLTPWIGLADDDEAIIKYRPVDGNNEAEVKSLILSDLGAYLTAQSAEAQVQIKNALQAVLLANSIDFGSLFDSLLPPFDHPENARDLFQWIWEALFPETN